MSKETSFAKRLTAALLKNDTIEEKEAESVAEMFHDRTKGRIDYFLLDEGIVEREDLLQALSSVYQIPSFDVKGYFFDNDLLSSFPKDVLISKAMIPLQIDEDILIMITSDPEDPELLDDIGHSVSYDVEFNVGLRRDIIDAIEEYYEQSLPIEEEEDFKDDEEELKEIEDDSDMVDFL